MEATTAASPAKHVSPSSREFHIALVAAGSLAFIFAALILAARRVSGGLEIPLSGGPLILLGVLFPSAAAAVRWALVDAIRRYGGAVAHRRTGLVALWGPTVVLLAMAVAVTLPGTPRNAATIFWIAVVALDATAWWIVVRNQRSSLTQRNTELKTAPSLIDRAALVDETDIMTDAESLAHGVTQRIDRGIDADGREYCHGWIRKCFAERQRTELVHIAFCPPFSTTPQMHIEQADGPELQLKTSQVLPYGARLEIRLARAASEPIETLIEFSAFENVQP